MPYRWVINVKQAGDGVVAWKEKRVSEIKAVKGMQIPVKHGYKAVILVHAFKRPPANTHTTDLGTYKILAEIVFK